jgi:type I restriction enzyme R subunit
LKQDKSLRVRLLDLPFLQTDGLRDYQINAITNLEKSFKDLYKQITEKEKKQFA